MCDYSLEGYKTRPAAVGDVLVTRKFSSGTTAFCEASVGWTDDQTVAVCLMPGTELGFDAPVFKREGGQTQSTTAIFRQINLGQRSMHHDALELSNGETCMLTYFSENQVATVLQLPSNKQKTKVQERVAIEA